jgi:hypothetical protein
MGVPPYADTPMAQAWKMCNPRLATRIRQPQSCMTDGGIIPRSPRVSLQIINAERRRGEKDAKRHRDCLACRWCSADHLWDASLSFLGIPLVGTLHRRPQRPDYLAPPRGSGRGYSWRRSVAHRPAQNVMMTPLLFHIRAGASCCMIAGRVDQRRVQRLRWNING